MKVLVTGGAGFIGSAVVRECIGAARHSVVNVDRLSYAGNLESLGDALNAPEHAFEQIDIGDRCRIDAAFAKHRPDAVLHLAAESHVDRSIDGPADFVQTNVVGSFVLLEAALAYWRSLDETGRARFRFVHVSTDEVYGDLPEGEAPFEEDSRYQPSSPYAASKAASDHLARAWFRTYGLPVIVTNCSNNYGPYQFPEKLIPHMILNALGGRPLPVYGDGAQIRDWLHVEDHARALLAVLDGGRPGETYAIGARCERRNGDLVDELCRILDELAADCRPPDTGSFRDLIESVADRPGHDRRYAMNPTKVMRELGWSPRHTLDSGLRQTVSWYLDNESWWGRVLDGSYRLERMGGPQ